ncbi:MAG: RNA pseudouridine synthase [Cyclobacteriaceae bacterium]|nr:RNA pseudouridine synthase [Cyclobacteriaceae bacterium]
MKKLQIRDLILFENTDYLAINKPYGISTLEDRMENTNILAMAKETFPDIQVCHRLDKDTSGILMLAKNPEAYKHLAMQFQRREVDKTYHAVVHGNTSFDHELVDLPLTVKGHGIVKWDVQGGKESTTYFTTLQNFKLCSLIECKPLTGRRHQIRVHLKFITHPILADTMYEGSLLFLSQIKRNYKASQRDEKPMINRMPLHAYSIAFELVDGQSQYIEAPYPKDYEILLRQLNKYASA